MIYELNSQTLFLTCEQIRQNKIISDVRSELIFDVRKGLTNKKSSEMGTELADKIVSAMGTELTTTIVSDMRTELFLIYQQNR